MGSVSILCRGKVAKKKIRLVSLQEDVTRLKQSPAAPISSTTQHRFS